MKKKMILVLIIMALMFTASPVFARNITSCQQSLPGAIIDEKIPNIVHAIIVVIKVAVPILLVIFGMLDLMKGITAQKEDEIKKGQQIFVKRLIAGALVFFVFTIVQLIISFVASDESGDMKSCVNCFINGKKECSYSSK